MIHWLTRGVAFAALMVLLRVTQGLATSVWDTHGVLISLIVMAVFVVAVVAWAFIDGRADATRNPDPDRRDDLAMWWLLGGLIAGVVSGFIIWLISVFDAGVYAAGILAELSTTASFTALLVFGPAMAAVYLGRKQVDRQPPAAPVDRTETDVFAAVREEESSR